MTKLEMRPSRTLAKLRSGGADVVGLSQYCTSITDAFANEMNASSLVRQCRIAAGRGSRSRPSPTGS
jgi:hypothetical protein